MVLWSDTLKKKKKSPIKSLMHISNSFWESKNYAILNINKGLYTGGFKSCNFLADIGGDIRAEDGALFLTV